MSGTAGGGLTAETANVARDSAAPPYLWGLIAGGAVFLLYVVTLSPTTAFWDTSEYIATAHTLGVPHPPGNPLFLTLARAWEILLAPLGLSVAVRINLFSAFVSGAAHGLWFLVVHHILFSEHFSHRVPENLLPSPPVFIAVGSVDRPIRIGTINEHHEIATGVGHGLVPMKRLLVEVRRAHSYLTGENDGQRPVGEETSRTPLSDPVIPRYSIGQ